MNKELLELLQIIILILMGVCLFIIIYAICAQFGVQNWLYGFTALSIAYYLIDENINA